MTLKDYTNVDCDITSIETLKDGWENQLLQGFVAEKTQATNPASNDSDMEDEDTIETQQEQSSITSYAEAVKPTAEVSLNTMENGPDSVLPNIMSAESGLQEYLLKHNSIMRQSTLDCIFSEISSSVYFACPRLMHVPLLTCGGILSFK